jgi:hypothetical protein
VRLGRDLPRRERLELDDLEPGVLRLEAVATALTGSRLKLQLESDARGRDPDLCEVRDEPAQAAPHRAARPHRAEVVQALRPRRGEVHLPDQDRRLRRLAPPLGRVAAGVRRVGDRDRDGRTERVERLHEREDVGAVLRVRRAPRRRRLRAEQLVLGDQRCRAAGDLLREDELLLRLRLDAGRIRGYRRRADAIVEVQIEEDGRGARLPHLLRHRRARGDGEHEPRLGNDRRVVARIVDPEWGGRRQAAGGRVRAPARNGDERSEPGEQGGGSGSHPAQGNAVGLRHRWRDVSARHLSR